MPAPRAAAAVLRQALALAAGGAMLVMVVLTCVDVIGRYGFHNSVFGASEMIELLMVAVVFGGLAFVTASDEHITVTLFDHLLHARAPRLMRWLRFWFVLVIYGLVAWSLWRIALGAWADGLGTIVLSLPMWLFSGLAAALTSAGCVIFALTASPLSRDGEQRA